MTELFLAYEQQMNDYDNNQPSLQIPNNKQQQQYEYEKASMQIKNGSQDSQIDEDSHNLQIQQQQQQMPKIPQKQQLKENFQMYQPVQQQYRNSYYSQRYPEYSFWDRMVMSKREVLKLFILSMVIILAISLEKLGSYYITSYLTTTDLSSLQEFMVRLSFPIIIFLFL